MTEVAQVGGNHYASEYQHWDFVEDMEMGYLEGCATKYMARWGKKDGLKDLKKARSYVLKLLVRHEEHGRENRSCFKPEAFAEFLEANKIAGLDGTICAMLALWKDSGSLRAVLSLISHLIATNYPETLQAHVEPEGITPWTMPVNVIQSDGSVVDEGSFDPNAER